MVPQVLTALAEPATKVPMKDHVKSENKSQPTECNTLVIPPKCGFQGMQSMHKAHAKTHRACKAHMLSIYKEIMAVQ